jgi:hypothetical protein
LRIWIAGSGTRQQEHCRRAIVGTHRRSCVVSAKEEKHV